MGSTAFTIKAGTANDAPFFVNIAMLSLPFSHSFQTFDVSMQFENVQFQRFASGQSQLVSKILNPNSLIVIKCLTQSTIYF